MPGNRRMTAPNPGWPAATPPPPPDVVVTLMSGNATARWCTTCKAWTVLAGDLLLLSPGGVSTVGEFAWCEICDDPDQQQEATRA